MAVTSGFFNSLNGDRKYNAEQMSAIFDGIINDGILANIGTAFTVSASSGLSVTVGIGRAWFNSTWVYNDAILPITLDISEVVLDRIDAVVIEVDRSDAVRAGSIKVVKGTPATSPQNPTMTSTNYVHQYPLAYIYRAAGSTEITQSQITSMIGTSSAPYVTGILQVQNIDNIVAQWGAQWIEWYGATTNMGEQEIEDIIAQWNEWFLTETTSSESEISQWFMTMKSDFEAWFDELTVILDENTAATLTARILELEEKFETLAKERTIYVPVEDSSGDGVQDSYGNDIEGRSIFTSGADEDVARVEALLNNHIGDKTIHSTPEEKIVTLIHSKSGTVHTLEGIPASGGLYTAQFRATADFDEGDTFSGEYDVLATGGEPTLPGNIFVTDNIVSVMIDTEGKKINFKMGGSGVNDTLPPQVTNFEAAAGNTQVTLSWDDVPQEWATGVLKDYVIVYKAGGIPTSVNDGERVIVPYEST